MQKEVIMAEFNKNRIRVNRISYWISSFILKIMGWKQSGEMPDVPKSVLIVAHHTSNWDFPIGLMLSYKMQIKAFWIGKHTLFNKPHGFLFKALGGVPVDRRSRQNLVEQVTAAMSESDEFVLVLAPEGTRKRTDKWKTGFYHIARQAQVPIVLGFLDFKKKIGGVGPAIYPSDDVEADVAKIHEFYRGISAKIPEFVGDMIIEPKI